MLCKWLSKIFCKKSEEAIALTNEKIPVEEDRKPKYVLESIYPSREMMEYLDKLYKEDKTNGSN